MYLEYYNFTKHPFALNADPDFFYESSTHKKGKLFLRYGLSKGEGFVLVTGAPGLGKTMLIKELCASLQQQKKVKIGVIVSTHLDTLDILKVIAETFDISHKDSKADILNNFQSFLLENAKQGIRILLVVDEAHNLPQSSLEELRMLMNFEFKSPNYFQIFLLGQESLNKKLDDPDLVQLKQRIIAKYQLQTLGFDETKEYITHRLRNVNWQGDPKFTEAAFDKIHKYTQGIPRIINTFCDRVLLYGFLEELHRVDEQEILNVILDFDTI